MMKRLFANIVLFVVVAVICISLAEVGLRALTPFPIHGERANKIYDRDFGYRLNLNHPTIDRNGFRNKGEKKGIVAAIGDSHTYGSGVKYEEAWPVVFEKLSGTPTYNFGVGSYAVYTYYAIAKQAIAQGYKHLIIALNIHNDFTPKGTSCDIDYNSSPFWQEAKARLSLALPTCELEDTWRTADAPEFIRKYHGKLKGNSAILSAWDYLVVKPFEGWWHKVTFDERPNGVSRTVKKDDQERKTGAMLASQSGKRPASWYFNKRGLAVLKEALNWTDLKHPITRDGVEDFEKMLLDLKRALDDKGGALGILMIPPKAKLTYEHTDNKDVFERVPWLKRMAENLIELDKRLTDFMDANAIAWRSPQLEIVEQIGIAEKEGTRVYKPTDNHPYPIGFRMYGVAAVHLYKRMTEGR